MAGQTDSADFPTRNSFHPQSGGGTCGDGGDVYPCPDAFVLKLDASGSLVYATYLGGNREERATAIAVDSAGSAYVAGYTRSTDFPTRNAVQGTYAAGNCGSTAAPIPCYDAFVTKLSPDGQTALYSSYLGGTGDDFAAGIAVDASGAAYLVGVTSSTNFSVTSGALQTAYGGGNYDAFVTKLSPAGLTRIYSTYVGGDAEDRGAGIAVDSSGNAYITGSTSSTHFPTTPGAFQAAFGGGRFAGDAFVMKLSAGGSTALYSTFLGGSGDDYGYSIALDNQHSAYITGLTASTDFPVTPGAFQAAGGGTSPYAFVTKLDAQGSGLSYSSYLGGVGAQAGEGIAVDSFGNATVTGYAYGPGFPTASATQRASGGFYDAFVARLNSPGSALTFSTFLGGAGNDVGQGVALDSSGNAYVAGGTFSTDFPATRGAFEPVYRGGSFDAFVAKIAFQSSAAVTLSPEKLSLESQNVGTPSAPQLVLLMDTGTQPVDISSIAVSGNFEQSNNCGNIVPPETSCALSVTFVPTSMAGASGTISITDNASGSPHTVALTGTVLASVASPQLALSATSLTFGDQPVGSTSAAQNVAINNIGNSPLDITNISSTQDYAQTNNCLSPLQSGAACNISVAFSPSLPGTSVGALTINDNAPGSPHAILLKGSGVKSARSAPCPAMARRSLPCGARGR